MIINIVKILIIILLFTSCAHHPQINQENAIQLAKKAAIKSGYKIEDYKEPVAHFEFTRKNKTWTVFFDARGNSLSHFLVWVDDKTGKTNVVPGE
jgi:hypothetical protein